MGAVRLWIRDRKGYIERSVEQAGISTDVTATTLPTSERKKGDKILQISLRESDKLEAPVFSYSCSARLKPIPMVRL